MNEVLESSLRAGSESHPIGSEAVKEMFSADGTLEGWAVMVKTQAGSDGGKGWFWYEVASVEPDAAPVASGNGIPLCFGCHSTGADYVLSDYPLPDATGAALGSTLATSYQNQPLPPNWGGLRPFGLSVALAQFTRHV